MLLHGRPHIATSQCTQYSTHHRQIAAMLSSRSLSLLAPPLRRAFHASTGRQAIQTVNVPSMGDSISEGTLVEIVKKAGDAVHADEVVLVLETDKVPHSRPIVSLRPPTVYHIEI